MDDEGINIIYNISIFFCELKRMINMMNKIGLLLIVMMVFVGCAMAEENNVKDKNPYKITPSKNVKNLIPSDDAIQIRTTFDTITQGETNWHSKYISYSTTTLDINLNWGDPSDSLKLTIYTPDGYTLGPYSDNSDGSVDGKIDIDIRNSNGIATGTWNYRVYGQSVSGTESYSI